MVPLNILNSHFLFKIVVQLTIFPTLPLILTNGFQNSDSHSDWILSTIEISISYYSITIKTLTIL